MTSIIKLESSPSQHRKHYNNHNNNHHHNHNDQNDQISSATRRSKNDELRKSMPTSTEFKKSNFYSNESKIKLPFDTIDRIGRTTTDIDDELNNKDNDYYPLSSSTQCLSQSESNISTSFQSTSNNQHRLCNRYGFFIDNCNDNNTNDNDDNNDENYETPSIQQLKLLRKKERKWLEMLNNWRYFINYKWDKIRDRCRKGIPHSLRSQAWFHLCGAHLQRNRFPNLYSQLLHRDIPADIHDDILKDLHRQFPNHEMFADSTGNGQIDLYNVLKAFAAYRPRMGYCQAQAPITAVLLMHMPAERAFWCLVALSKYYISGYFVHNLEDIRIHGQMLVAFLKKYSPSSYNLLHRQHIEPEMYMTEWFMCIYSRNLPWPSVLRVWDMFFCEGLTILFKVGLYLIDVALKNETNKTCPTMNETYQKLRNLPKQLLKEELLIRGIKKYELKDIDLLKEHKQQKKKFLKSSMKK